MKSQVVELRDPSKDACWSAIENAGVLSLITHANLAITLAALHQSGIAAKLYDRAGAGTTTAKLFEGRNPYLGGHLLKYLQVHGLVQEDVSGTVRPSSTALPMFSPVAGAQLGFYLETYLPIVSRIASFLDGRLVYGKDIVRDGKTLGIHCATLFREFHTPTVLEALADLESRSILDLGCGAGQFLIDACEKDRGITGIGLDISGPAIEEANRITQEKGLQARLQFVVGDAFKPDTWPQACLNADTICAVGVVHEHFRDGEEAVIAILNTYGDLLRAHRKSFLLGEPEIRYDLKQNDPDLFLIHVFTAQGFPRHREEWLELLEKTTLNCVRVYTRPAAGPRFNFFLCNP